MRGDHTICRLIKGALQIRNIKRLTLGKMIGATPGRLHKLLSTDAAKLTAHECRQISTALAIPIEWLTEARTIHHAFGRLLVQMGTDKQRTAPEVESAPHLTQSGTDENELNQFLVWRNELDSRWRRFLDMKRSPVPDPLQRAMDAASGTKKSWAQFHRSVALGAASKNFSPVYQRIIAQALSVPGTPSESLHRRWLIAYGKVMRTGIQHDHTEEKKDDIPFWPGIASGECYEMLRRKLVKEKRRRLSLKKFSGHENSDTSVSDVNLAIRWIFAHRFIDDPLLSLVDIVREYRRMRNSCDDRGENFTRMAEENGLGESDIWDQFDPGVIMSEASLVREYERFSFNKARALEALDDMEGLGKIGRFSLASVKYIVLPHPLERELIRRKWSI